MNCPRYPPCSRSTPGICIWTPSEISPWSSHPLWSPWYPLATSPLRRCPFPQCSVWISPPPFWLFSSWRSTPAAGNWWSAQLPEPEGHPSLHLTYPYIRSAPGMRPQLFLRSPKQVHSSLEDPPPDPLWQSSPAGTCNSSCQWYPAPHHWNTFATAHCGNNVYPLQCRPPVW